MAISQRKKYQRAMNAMVRRANKMIKKDWLWNGRFVISQTQASFVPYADHSGGDFAVILECKDTKTGRTMSKIFDNYDNDTDLYFWINDCIVEYFEVWEEVPNPREVAIAEGRCPN